MVSKVFILISLIAAVSGPLLCGGIGNKGTGFKYIRNHTPRDYKHPPQNWSIIQDKKGIVYVANQGGILNYNGVYWEEVVVPNVIARSVAMDDTGTVYVGGNNEIGFLDSDSKGDLHYVSLLNSGDEQQPNFARVMRMHPTRDGIYCRTSKFIFRLRPGGGGHEKTWRPLTPDARFYGSFVCGGRFFVRHKGLGLMEMVDDSLTLVPGGGIFAETGIFAMVPFENNRYLVGTRTKGFYIYDGSKMVPFPTEADDYINEKGLSYAIRLSSEPGHFALATLRGGLVIMDNRGKIKEIFTRTSGLQDDNVKYVFEDSGGNLWLALEKGISKIEYASPISMYDRRSNLPGIVLSVSRHGPRRTLYAGTTKGLYYLDKDNFLPVPGMSGACNYLLSHGGSLWAASNDGVFKIDNTGNHTSRKVIGYTSYFLLRARGMPHRIWVGTERGLASIYSENGRWTGVNEFKKITDKIYYIAEDNNGDLWLGTLNKGVLKIDFPSEGTSGEITNYVVNRYTASHGLPPGDTFVCMAAGHVIAATRKGLFRFDENGNGFTPDHTLGEEYATNHHVFRLTEDKNKNIWFSADFEIFRAIPQPGGTFALDSTPFLRLPLLQVNNIYPDPGGDVVWFPREDGLIRFDSTVEKNYKREYTAHIYTIRKIDDYSTIFYGHPGRRAPNRNAAPPPIPAFDFDDGDLRFEYAALFFDAETKTRYQYFLEGNDDHWSHWTNETKKDYTNLDAGTYTFRVRAKNIYRHISREDRYRFEILPPWYRTWWAYIIYALCVGLVFNLLLKWRHKHLIKEKKDLERVIKNRTHQLEIQSEQLKELDKAKSRFFANLSHEFRTPITLIMGPLEQILAGKPGNEIKKLGRLMLRNAHRLLNLVNQLLELARLDSGKMKLEASLQNIAPFLKSVTMCFESLADQNEVDLIFHDDAKEIPVYFDMEKLEKILTNLLANAFKYTPAKGKITVTVRKIDETDPFPSGCVEISVHDTGTGIPPERLPHIFDRFYHAESSIEHKQKGTGIGLALVKELVELHHGRIHVRSSCRDDFSRGTEFTLQLPLGDRHLQPEEIVGPVAPGDKLPVSKALSPAAAYTAEHVETEEKTEDDSQLIEAGPPAPEEEKSLVLVVDDNADVRLYIRGALDPNFNIVEAADGKEGVLRAKEILPDLIVSDVMMPEVDGYELCRTLKSDVLTSHIPIILLTAKVAGDSILEGLESGADDYIAKPFSTAALTVRGRNLIDLRRQLQIERKNRMVFQPAEIPVSPMDNAFYKTLQDTLETHLGDPDFNVDALSRTLQMSQATLYRKLQALTGTSPTLFIRSFRLKRAAQLLAAGAGSVAEVALSVGLPDPSYFTRCFKEQFNRLPSEINPNGTGPIPIDEGPVEVPDRVSEGGKDLILVVEDNGDVRGYIRGALESHYRVVEAVDGGEGISRALELLPDLIVSDVMMPGTDGYELCAALKKDVRTSHIPIVLLTARAGEESKIRGLETGADDYIVKPFNTDILLARIRNLIRLRGFMQRERDREMVMLPSRIKGSEIDDEFVKELNTVIRKNLSDAEFNVEQLAAKIYMSSSALYRKVKAISGETPSEYIRSCRLHRAAQLLKNNFGSVTEVAFEVGFNSRTYFTRCFKEKFHRLPSVYVTDA